MRPVIVGGARRAYSGAEEEQTMVVQDCSCRQHDPKATITTAAPPVTATQTVDEVARRSPAARDVLQRMGINHCCGAHLTLREAAAAAGVETGALLRALDAATGATT
jgi:hypothetical protein